MAKPSAELLEILVCPVPECRAALVPHDQELVCAACGLRYPCEGAWPTLVPEEARPAENQEAR